MKRDLLKKKSERDGAKLIEDLLWGVPKESALSPYFCIRFTSLIFNSFVVQEPSLVDFWQTNFKVQLEARSGELSIHLDNEPERPPRKKKRLSTVAEEDEPLEEQERRGAFDEFGGGYDGGMDMGMMMDVDNGLLFLSVLFLAGFA